jgi:signal transduction histidine kinase/CheY-like chemotaxis protein
LLAAAAFWSALGALEFAAVDLAAKTILSQLSYLGIVAVPATLFCFAYAHTRGGRNPPPALLRSLAALGAFIVLAVWTNPLHGAVWPEVRLLERGGFVYGHYERGPLFWFNIAYCYGLMAASTLLIVRHERGEARDFRRQNWMALLAVFGPWLTSAAYVLRLGPLGVVDHTPVGFAASGLFMTWAVMRYRLFDLQPVAAETLFDRMPDPVLALDGRGHLVRHNPAAAARFGLSPADLGSAPAGALGRRHAAVASALRPAKPDGTEVISDGDCWWEVQSCTLNGVPGAPAGRMFVLRDVTAQHTHEAALRAAEQRTAEALRRTDDALATARAADSAKTVFLAQVSHDLRTPLHAIIGMPEVLHDGSLSATQRHELGIVRDAAESLLRQINDLLDLTRLESGRLELACRDFLLDDVLDPIVDLLGVTAARKGLVLQAWIEPGLDGTLHGDPDRLRQILQNLVGNAVKFTVQGEVTVRAFADGAPAQLVIEVQDTGPGLAEEQIERLFRPFERGPGVGTVEGTGLGLAIVDRMVRAMKGGIEVTSLPGAGACFRVKLPLLTDRVAVELAALREALDGRLCEMIGGTPTEVRAITANLGSLGARVAHEPAETPPALRSADGESLVPLYALHRRTLAGVLLAPPVVATSLPVARPAPPAPTRRRVLLADDTAVARKVTSALLQRLGCDVVAVDSGTAALARLAAEPFDMVVLDGMMPELDGWETTRRLRQGEAGARAATVPVIGLSADASTGAAERWREAGATAALTKPARQAEIAAALEVASPRPICA